jgi:signal transduction histidine kinase
MADDAPRLLLVEGDPDTVLLIQRSLNAAGTGGAAFAVTSAPRVSTACRLLAGERFEAVLLDLELPQSVGLEGFRKIRAQAPDAAIVLLAGPRDEDIAAQAVGEGAQDYLTKGTLEFCLLERAIRHAVERKRLSKEIDRLLALRRGGDGPAATPRAEAGDDIKIQFLARISHELRNTLATVKTAVFCLSDAITEPLTPRQARLVEMISRNVDRQVKLIENILDLSRFQSGKLKIDSRPMQLSRVLDEVAAEFRMRGKPQTLEFELPESLPPVAGDPDLIVQVLRNLLENALRFARSKITVTLSNAGDEGVAVSVVDDGDGIPAEQLGKLFNQFVQLERAADESGYKGTGLGLAICKEIIEAHRGRIWAESRPGQGARFCFTLPAHEMAEPAPAGRARAGASPPVLAPSAGMDGLNRP